MTDADKAELMYHRAERLRRGLLLALEMLLPHEPPDSCAVSDEFVALAALSTGDENTPVMTIIDNALKVRGIRP